MDPEKRLRSIDRETLNPLVQQALDSQSARVIEWQRCLLHGGTTRDPVSRFTGTAWDEGQVVPWSLILKVRSVMDPGIGDANRWRREALVYRSGIVANLPGDLMTPRCFGVVRQAVDEFWIWLEDVEDWRGPRWPLSRYALAARHFGQFNGAFLASLSLPAYPWLSKGRWGPLAARAAPHIAQLQRYRDHPLVGRQYPPDIYERILRLWRAREPLLQALERVPKTLCHLDAFRRNLFSRPGAEGREQTVAIDWDFMGVAPLGEELSVLVQASLYFDEVEVAQARSLDEHTFAGYMAGLEEAGWQGDWRLVRFGYTASLALACLGCLQIVLSFLLAETGYARPKQYREQPVEERMSRQADVWRILLRLADEAMELLPYFR